MASAFEEGLALIADSPVDVGTVELIARRPADGEREVVGDAQLDVEVGLVGDNWSTRPNRHTADGGPDPDAQVTVMNARAAALFATARDQWPLAGDQLYVDFDLSEANVAPGTRLSIGSAVVEVTAEPHNGCAKFRRRFGEDVLRLVNSPRGKQLHLRGINTKVVVSGEVRPGDEVRKVSST
jgi:MOSC domain-containing protein YiiM